VPSPLLRALPLLLLTIAQADPASAPPPRTLDFAPLFSDADYPAEALANNEAGTVVFRLDIDRKGRVSRCTITTSSGAASLDATTCRVLRQRARFTAKRNADGKPVPATVEGHITWHMP